MNKKGIVDVLYIIIALLVLSIVLVVGLKFFSEITDELAEEFVATTQI